MTRIVVGLGNPGPEYEHTRHNAGFLVVDLLGENLRATYWKDEAGAKVAVVRFGDEDLVLAKPQTFMNVSGGSVAKLAEAYDAEPRRPDRRPRRHRPRRRAACAPSAAAATAATTACARSTRSSAPTPTCACAWASVGRPGAWTRPTTCCSRSEGEAARGARRRGPHGGAGVHAHPRARHRERDAGVQRARVVLSRRTMARTLAAYLR